MRYQQFWNTDLKVSAVCLGTVDYGTPKMPREKAYAQMDAFLEAGGNFIDTAKVYGAWNPGERDRSEIIIGEWLARTKKRNQVVLSTKGAHPQWGKMEIPRVSEKHIRADLEESLQRLQTDFIDLYFLHRDDESVPVGEIVECLNEQEKKGNIRYYGCSNWKTDRIREANRYARAHGMKGFVCNQLMWSLADINAYNLEDPTFVLMDRETYRFQEEEKINIMAYMSASKGYFAKKCSREPIADSVARIYENESNEEIFQLIRRLQQESREAGREEWSGMDYMMSYIMSHQVPSVPIASFSSEKQFAEVMKSVDRQMEEEVLEAFEKLKKYVLDR